MRSSPEEPDRERPRPASSLPWLVDPAVSRDPSPADDRPDEPEDPDEPETPEEPRPGSEEVGPPVRGRGTPPARPDRPGSSSWSGRSAALDPAADGDGDGEDVLVRAGAGPGEVGLPVGATHSGVAGVPPTGVTTDHAFTPTSRTASRVAPPSATPPRASSDLRREPGPGAGSAPVDRTS
ncbi:hypothetical protein [Friedmanniella luteola]|uniref:hypothetical protein n=1 Tax=Friedmanniella luteola TaxID=546871 RepID=UPI0012FE4611|nr:hypothetical protein [Friedmanniella luteola]